MALHTAAILLTIATTSNAQFGGFGGYGGGNYGGGGNNGGNDPYSGGNNGANYYSQLINQYEPKIIAHAVLASLAFVIFFPVGGILIRLGSFPRLWLVHGLFQCFAYAVYIAAFGIGVWMVNSIPYSLWGHAHPIIGTLLFVLVFLQPILGYVHHLFFKKYSRRTFWSYAHIWLGRIVITLGIINGGLGIQLTHQTGMFKPSKGQTVAYAVVAVLMWLIYVLAIIFGETKRRRAQRVTPVNPPKYARYYQPTEGYV